MSFTISGTSGLTFPDTTSQTTAATASIPAGAKTNFLQAAAPTGWTQCTTYNNYAMRLVSGTGGGTGGSVAFTTAFASQTPAGTIGATTLTTCQIPAHNHSFTYPVITVPPAGPALAGGCTNPKYTTESSSQNKGGGGSHNHSFSGTAINLAVQYVDNIVATKN